MSQRPEVERAAARAEAARLIELLASIVRLLGFSMRQVELRAGLNHSTTSRYLRGEGEPTLTTLLGIARAVGLESWEFFDIAFPVLREPSDSGRQLRRKLEMLVPGSQPPPEQPPATETDLAASICELQRELRALLGKSAG